MNAGTRLTVAGAVASLLAILPLMPITEQNAWIVPSAVAIALVVLTGSALRRTRLPRGLTPLIQLIVLTLWLGLMVAADVAWMVVVPTPAWFERLALVYTEGTAAILEYAAPVPVDRGLQFLIVAGAGLVAIAVELAVFGLRRVPLAGLPIALFYAIAATVVREGWSWFWFIPPAIGYVLVLVAEGQERVLRWGRSAGPSARRTGIPETGALARNGRRVGAVAVAAAVIVPTSLPALTDGLIDGSGGSGGSGGGRTIRTDNPIVDLRRDLSRPDNVDMLRYFTDADRPEYIRTATLDVFNGEEWGLSQRDVPQSQRIDEGLPWPPGLDPTEDVRFADYDFEVSNNFGSRWLPLAYPAQTIEIGGDWRYDVSTLDVVSPDEDVHGTAYTATSIDLHRDSAELREAPSFDADEFADLVELPDGMADTLEDYLDEAIGDLSNPHEQAVALQAWFRNEGGFEYSLEPAEGTSSDHLIDFLTERIGYCEQYAATMAIMARALDIPARVAVGFTPGELMDDGSRIIRAHDAHAWPELYFEGTGWVRFEPTPARRTGTAPAWTLPPRDDSGEENVPGAGGVEGDLDPTAPSDVPVNGLDFDDGLGFGGPIDGPSRWPMALLVLAVAGALVLTPHGLARAVRAARWRRAAGSPAAEAETAWSEFADAVRDAGMSWDDAATPRGVRRHVTRQVGGRAEPSAEMNRLVEAIERARYAARASADPDLLDVTNRLRADILQTRSTKRRVRAWLLPVAFTDLVGAGLIRIGRTLSWLDTAGDRLRVRMATANRR